MAIWQFRFSIVPELGIITIHGTVPAELDAFKPVDPDEEDPEDLPNYWANSAVPPEIIQSIAGLLPTMESWSSDALMFGTEEGNQIQVWPDELLCKIDMRQFDPELLRRMVQLAEDLHCVVVLNENGRVLQAEYGQVLEACKDSRAYKFTCNPVATLNALRRNSNRSKGANPEKG